jgi:hypothetical protein
LYKGVYKAVFGRMKKNRRMKRNMATVGRGPVGKGVVLVYAIYL